MPPSPGVLYAFAGGVGPFTAAPGFFKFPRTRHVVNPGGTAVARDDLVMDDAEAARFFDGQTLVTAEEKVGGFFFIFVYE